MAERIARRFIGWGVVATLAIVGCFNAWWWLALVPLATYRLARPQARTSREAWTSSISPALLLLPCLMVVWIRSHQAVSFLLMSVGQDRFVGGYLFPGVIEVGYYEHDPAGREYLRDGITPEIAPFMTDNMKRFQTLEGSGQVYDFVCIDWGYCRAIPVIESPIAAGSIYAGLLPGGWTPSSFYTNFGPWVPGLSLRSTHVGFPVWVGAVLAAVPFGWRVYVLHRGLRRVQRGFCGKCGYDLTANVSGICPECGTRMGKGMADVLGTEKASGKTP